MARVNKVPACECLKTEAEACVQIANIFLLKILKIFHDSKGNFALISRT
jgi:hypothetical protein